MNSQPSWYIARILLGGLRKEQMAEDLQELELLLRQRPYLRAIRIIVDGSSLRATIEIELESYSVGDARR